MGSPWFSLRTSCAEAACHDILYASAARRHRVAVPQQPPPAKRDTLRGRWGLRAVGAEADSGYPTKNASLSDTQRIQHSLVPADHLPV